MLPAAKIVPLLLSRVHVQLTRPADWFCPLQFARPHDVEMFLRPPSRLLEPTMLGGSPFFT